MKKTLAIILAIMMITGMTLTAFADNSIGISSVEVTGSEFNVKFTTTGLGADDQVTLLTYQADSTSAAPTESNIKYIDQITKGEETAIDFSLATTPNGTYQVKMGGTDINTPAVVTVTVGDNMAATKYYDGHAINLFSDALTVPDHVTDETGKTLILKNDKRYVAAYATAPEKAGYTVSEYGVWINGANKQAKVDLTNTSYAYGMLFYGSAIANGQAVTVVPYVVYTENGTENTVTYYGDTAKATLTTTAQ